MLKRLRKWLRRDEKGQGMVEYGLILALVSVVALGALSGIGDSVKDQFGNVNDAMNGPVITGDSIYTESEIDNLVKEGNIPILNADDLNNLRESTKQVFAVGTKWEGIYLSGLDKKYIQVSDIDLGGIENFEPIGTWNNKFTGEFNGGGYSISMVRPTELYLKM